MIPRIWESDKVPAGESMFVADSLRGHLKQTEKADTTDSL